VALVGCGYWGKNLLRNILGCGSLSLATVCDGSAEVAQWLRERHGLLAATDYVHDVLADPTIEAVVVATPAAHHAAQARLALEAGKHVLVEKPLALTASDAASLAGLAAKRGLVLMPGHTFLYHAAVQKLRALIADGELGEIHYIASQRLSLGIVRSDVDALWNLAPHDISIFNYLLGEFPSMASAQGDAYLQPGIADVQYLHLRYPSGRAAHAHVSWLHPRKVREMAIVGSRKMALFDDVSVDRKITIFDKGIDRLAPRAAALPGFQTFAEFQGIQRAGEIVTPTIDFKEPLGVELAHFAECVRNNTVPTGDALSGVATVATLEAASHSMASGGAFVPVQFDRSPTTGDPR